MTKCLVKKELLGGKKKTGLSAISPIKHVVVVVEAVCSSGVVPRCVINSHFVPVSCPAGWRLLHWRLSAFC